MNDVSTRKGSGTKRQPSPEMSTQEKGAPTTQLSSSDIPANVLKKKLLDIPDCVQLYKRTREMIPMLECAEFTQRNLKALMGSEENEEKKSAVGPGTRSKGGRGNPRQRRKEVTDGVKALAVLDYLPRDQFLHFAAVSQAERAKETPKQLNSSAQLGYERNSGEQAKAPSKLEDDALRQQFHKPEWIEQFDLTYSRKYWHNLTTGESTWVRPDGLLPDKISGIHRLQQEQEPQPQRKQREQRQGLLLPAHGTKLQMIADEMVESMSKSSVERLSAANKGNATDMVPVGVAENIQSQEGPFLRRSNPKPKDPIDEKLTNARATLHEVCASGNKQLACELLQTLKSARVNIHIKDSVGRTPLHIAVMNGHKDIVHMLLWEFSASCIAKDAMNCTALHYAAERGCLECAEYIFTAAGKSNQINELNIQNISGDSPLHSATRAGHLPMVNLLFRHGRGIDCDVVNNLNKKAVDIAFDARVKGDVHTQLEADIRKQMIVMKMKREYRKNVVY